MRPEGPKNFSRQTVFLERVLSIKPAFELGGGGGGGGRTKLHFHVNSSRKNSIVLTTNMVASSRGCKPKKIHCYLQSFSPYHFLRQRFVSCCISSLLLFSPFSFYDVYFVKKENKTKTSLICMKDSNSRQRSYKISASKKNKVNGCQFMADAKIPINKTGVLMAHVRYYIIFSSIWRGFLCAQVFPGNCETTES